MVGRKTKNVYCASFSFLYLIVVDEEMDRESKRVSLAYLTSLKRMRKPPPVPTPEILDLRWMQELEDEEDEDEEDEEYIEAAIVIS